MATDSIGSEEKHRWNENCKVYTRRFRNKNATSNNRSPAIATPSQAGEASNTTATNCNESGTVDKDESTQNLGNNANDIDNSAQFREADDANSDQKQPNSPVIEVIYGDTTGLNQQEDATSNNQFPATATPSQAGEASNTTATNFNESGTVDKDESTQNLNKNSNNINNSSQFREADDANSNQKQPNSPVIEVISGDTTCLNQQEGAFFNDHDENTVNESTLVRPLIERIDNDKVRINFSTALLKHKTRDLKRKLVRELEEVKELAKKLKYKEAQLTWYKDEFIPGNDLSTGIIGQSPSQDKEPQFSSYNDEFIHANGFSTGITGQCRSQYSTSDVGAAPYYDSMPFQHHSDNTYHVMKRAPKANQYYSSSEFISGTDKIPSIEIKKKTKSKGRKKQGKASSTVKQTLKKCATLLNKLMKNQFGWVFNAPVDVMGLNLYDYYDVIKCPMDLGTIKTRLSKNWYKSPLKFAEDVRLTFDNAMTYNPQGHDVHIMAVELLNIFEENWIQIEADYSTKLGFEPAYVSPPPPVYQETRELYLDRSDSIAQKPPVIKTQSLKKPKAGDLNKRDMTFEEKKKLSTTLENLPVEKLDIAVQIIKKRNSSFFQNDDEFEVDIDSIDAETLWELDRFVTNYRKNLSKQNRKAVLARQRSEAQQEIQATNPVFSSAEEPKETTTDDTTAISVSSPVLERKEAADITSSSSSSSSDSGWSSSDSESSSRS